jgi:predicted amino acid-binding ACT domain protein
MKKFLMSGMIAASLLTMPFAQAQTTICDAKIALADARFNLMMMVFSMDKAEQDALKTEIDKASTALEKVVKTMLKDERKFDDAQLTDFQNTWAQFKNTRETEIVPAIRAGNNDKAVGIATGIQAGRMNTMNGIIQALNGDNCDLE